MPERKVVQVWVCAMHGRRYDAPLPVTVVTCPDVHRRNMRNLALELIWDKERDGGAPPEPEREWDDETCAANG